MIDINIGFDLDGCIADADFTLLRLIDLVNKPEDKLKLETEYYASRKLLLNPLDFLSDKDSFYIITARPDKFKEVTMKWLNKNNIKPKDVIFIGYNDRDKYVNPDPKDFKAISCRIAKEKLDILKKLIIEIYFDDNFDAIVQFRELCKEIKFIQYGRRVY